MISRRCSLLARLAVLMATSLLPGLATAVTVVASNGNPGFASESIKVTAIITSDTVGYLPNGTVNFLVDSLPVPSCTGVAVQPGPNATARALCQLAGLTFGSHSVGAHYNGDIYTAPSDGVLTQKIVEDTPGIGYIISNPYGTLQVQGATLGAGTITNFSNDTKITLGPGSGLGPLVIQFDRFYLAPGYKFTVRGAADQYVDFNVDAPSGPVSIAGTLSGEVGGTLWPNLLINAPAGVNVHETGRIEAFSSLTFDALQGSYYTGKDVQNEGVIDGGNKLEAFAWSMKGGGAWQSYDTKLHFYGNANNPVSSNFLNNGLLLGVPLVPPPPPPPPPARVGPDAQAIQPTRVTLNPYGLGPQFINLKLMGNGSVWMPSAWPASFTFPQNNAVVPAGGSRPPGTPEPAYGGGSMIIHATGSLSFFDGGPTGTKDFVFPGAMVFISDLAIDLKGVTLNQGWTTTGRSFQGIFLEAPSITNSVGTINLFSNDLNWTNFSVLPMKSVAVSRLTLQPNGSASFANADLVAPHLNTYSTIAATAASGGCWVCLVNTVPVDMTHLP